MNRFSISGVGTDGRRMVYRWAASNDPNGASVCGVYGAIMRHYVQGLLSEQEVVRLSETLRFIERGRVAK